MAPRLSNRQWAELLWEARHHGCLARTSMRLEDAGRADAVPATAWEMLCSARPYVRFVQVRIAREIRKVHRVLRPLGANAMLLKGGAYLSLGLDFARGRAMNDLDIMVERDRLEAVEQALKEAGYQPGELNEYDQRYYREWMHEIPPLRHPQRGIELDVHHRVLPLTSRLNPEPALMWEDASELEHLPGLFALSAPDMLLHTATHLFHDGEIRGGLKDLLDIDGLIAAHRTTPDYWPRLLDRATRLQLGRPLYYALRFSSELLGASVPDDILAQARRVHGPGTAIERVIATLVPPVIAPAASTQGKTGLAGSLLYVRSHWLRMPPGLLTGHLTRKLIRRIGRDT